MILLVAESYIWVWISKIDLKYGGASACGLGNVGIKWSTKEGRCLQIPVDSNGHCGICGGGLGGRSHIISLYVHLPKITLEWKSFQNNKEKQHRNSFTKHKWQHEKGLIKRFDNGESPSFCKMSIPNQ